MQTKLAAVLAAQSAGEDLNVSAVCRELGISRKHYYQLRRRWLDGGIEALRSRSRRPCSSPGQLPGAVEDEIVRLRKMLSEQGLDAGARSIRYRLLAGQTAASAGLSAGLPAVSAVPAVSTIHRVLRRRGLVIDQPRKRPRSADRRFSYPDPNACWQIDGSQWRLADASTVCIMTVIDDHSRALLAVRAARGAENLEDAWAAVSAAIDAHGVPVRVLSDRGGALNGHPARQSEFRALGCAAAGYCRSAPAATTRRPAARTNDHTRRCTNGCAREPRPPPCPSCKTYSMPSSTSTTPNDPTKPCTATPRPAPTTPARKSPPAASSSTPTQSSPTPTVSSRGEIKIAAWNVQLGRRWAGCTVTAIREDLNLTVLNDTEVIRRLVINPDHRYQGNGRPYPRSSKPHPRYLLPKS